MGPLVLFSSVNALEKIAAVFCEANSVLRLHAQIDKGLRQLVEWRAATYVAQVSVCGPICNPCGNGPCGCGGAAPA